MRMKNATNELDRTMKYTSVPDALQLYVLTFLEVVTNYVYVTQCAHFLVCVIYSVIFP
jgi:hypothetical protein